MPTDKELSEFYNGVYAEALKNGFSAIYTQQQYGLGIPVSGRELYGTLSDQEIIDRQRAMQNQPYAPTPLQRGVETVKKSATQMMIESSSRSMQEHRTMQKLERMGFRVSNDFNTMSLELRHLESGERFLITRDELMNAQDPFAMVLSRARNFIASYGGKMAGPDPRVKPTERDPLGQASFDEYTRAKAERERGVDWGAIYKKDPIAPAPEPETKTEPRPYKAPELDL